MSFLFIFHFLSDGCFGRPMFHAFDGSFPFLLFFFIITAAYQAWSFYSFVYISLLYQLLWCGHGREGLRVWLSLGTRNKACGVEGGFFWVNCWAQVCRIRGNQVLISWEI